MLDLTKLLTPAQAAAELNLTPRIIRRYCKQGRLGQKIGGRYIITRADLERFRNEPRKVGKPAAPK
jgi:hypothetical protein